MRSPTKKAVILNNFSSPYISEAIIIFKEYDPRLESKVIADAEKIVSDYIKRNEHRVISPVHSRKSHLKLFFTFFIITLIAAAAIYAIQSL